MGIVELVERSAEVALEHAVELQDHLRSADETGAALMRECQAEMHQLVGDIVSLRNAAELMRRELVRPG